jgi:predicted transcriptional regulator
MKIIKISFFYKGHGIQYYDSTLNQFLALIDDYIKKTDKVVEKEGIDWMYKQLEEIRPYVGEEIEFTDELSPYYTAWALNIYYLTERNHMENDDMNGLLFMYEKKRN